MELPLLPGGALRGAEPDHRQHDPVEARAPVPAVGRGDGADLRRRRLPRRRLREHLRHERADRVGDRRPARPRRLRHRLRARRRRRRGDRRPESEEGRARDGRLRPVHRPRHRQPRRDGRGGRRCADRQRGPVVQRRETDDRDRRALRAVPREVHGRAHRREARAIRASARRSSGRCPLRSRPTASRIRSGARSSRARRSSPAASATATTSSRRC